MTVIRFPSDSGGFSSPVTIPVEFDNTVTFDDAVVFNSTFTIAGPVVLPSTLRVDGTSTFKDNVLMEKFLTVQKNVFCQENLFVTADIETDGVVDAGRYIGSRYNGGYAAFENDSDNFTPLQVSEASATLTEGVAAAFLYPLLNADGQSVAIIHGRTESVGSKLVHYRNTSSDLHYRIYPDKNADTYFYVTEAGALGYRKNGAVLFDVDTDTNTSLSLNSNGESTFFANSNTTSNHIFFQGLAPNIETNTTVSLAIGHDVTNSTRLTYAKGSGNVGYCMLRPCANVFAFLEIRTASFRVNLRDGANTIIPLDVNTEDVVILTNFGGTKDSSKPSLAGYTSYTPTIAQTGGTSAASITNLYTNWVRIANVVIVHFQIRVTQNTTTLNEVQTFTVSLPFTNTFLNSIQGAGSAVMNGGVLGTAICQSNGLNSSFLVTVNTGASGSGASILSGSFSYEVL